MNAVSLTSEQETLWTVGLVVGAVVLVVVIALMVFLLLLVRDVRSGVVALGVMVERLGGGVDAGALSDAVAALRELRDELALQDEELSRR